MIKNIIPVLLPIERKTREFDSKLLLTLHLVSGGFPVIIGSRHAIKRELKYLKKCIYISKSLSAGLIKLFNEIKEKNGLILVVRAWRLLSDCFPKVRFINV